MDDVSDYDNIMIDCPPALGLLTINGLVASNSVIIPLQCEYFALEGLSSLMQTIQSIKKSFNQKLIINIEPENSFDYPNANENKF